MTLHLLNIFEYYDQDVMLQILYDLLSERDPVANISHKRMPNFDEHVAFVRSNPYSYWWLILAYGMGVRPTVYGACYISKQNEIGIQLFKVHQGNGVARAALAELLRMFPEQRLLANVAPRNEKSRRLFEAAGFALCQYTFERTA